MRGDATGPFLDFQQKEILVTNVPEPTELIEQSIGLDSTYTC